MPGLNWRKQAGLAGHAEAGLTVAGDRLIEVPRFSVVAAEGLDIQGKVNFDAGKPRRVTLSHAKWGRTEARGSVTIEPNGAGLRLDVVGGSFDARELIAGEPSDPASGRARVKPQRPKTPAPPARRPPRERKEDLVPMVVDAKFSQVWLSDDGLANGVTARLERDHRDWRQLHIDGTVGAAKPIHVDIRPVAQNRRSLEIACTDAGAVLLSGGFFDNMVGGQLSVTGSYDDAAPGQPLTAQAKITDFHVVRAPALARLLSAATLTTILDLLSGDGIPFSMLDVPFTLTDGLVRLRDARAYGTSLGLTAKGQLDLDDDGVLNLEGTVVPVYVLNSVLGKLPLVGSVFSAEAGGGVFAMNYTMKGPARDPNVTVNPLSALAPGFFRNLFNAIDKDKDSENGAAPQPIVPAVPPH